MTTRPGFTTHVDPEAPGRADFEGCVPPPMEGLPGLHVHLHRSGVVSAQALPLPVAEARLRLPTWSRATLGLLFRPTRGRISWRDALAEAFTTEGGELLAMAGEQLLPTTVIAMQIERPFDQTFTRPAAAWELIEPWLSERFPTTMLLQYGRRLSALVPGLGVAELVETAEQLRRMLEAARAQRVLDATVSIGVAAFPDDARDLAPLMRLAEGAALRSSSLGTTVVRGVPTLLLIGEQLPVQVSESSLLQRLDVKVLHAPHADALAFLQREHPTAAVVDLAAPPEFLERLAGLLQTGRVPHTRLIFVSRNEADARTRDTWSRFAQSALVCGKDRLGGRTLEEIALSLGLKPRRYLRRGRELPVELEANGRTLKGLLLNISESGARVVSDTPVLEGLVSLRLVLPRGQVVASARVAWQRTRGGECEAGLRFESLGDDGHALVADFVGQPEEPGARARSAPRFEVKRRLKLKVRVRLRGGGATHYFALVDLAEGGCRSAGVDVEALQPGVAADLNFFGASGHFACVGEVVRRQPGASGVEYGWRFIELRRDDYGELKRLLSAFELDRPHQSDHQK